MADTAAKTPKLDTTPVFLEAQGNMPIEYLTNNGVKIAEAILDEWDFIPGGKRVDAGTVIRVEKHVADKLQAITIKSRDPRFIKKDVAAFVPAQNFS